MEKITSRENAKVKYACRLASSGAFRRAEGRFLAEGRKLCPELCRGAELETLFCTESALEKCPELSELPGEHYLVEDHVADKLADVGTHQGVFGVFRTPVHPLEEVKTGGRYLALERVQDPGNVGTLLRSAAAFGFDGVLLSDGCASVFAPKTLRASMGAAVRIFGGWISDHWGGVNTLTAVLVVLTVSLVLCGLSTSSLPLTVLLLIVCFAALGAGNGATFQLVPLRWPTTTAVAGSMIGEIGALGGGFITNALGLSKQFTGSYASGFYAFAACTVLVLGMLRFMQIRWTRTWAEKGGRARSA